MGTKIFVVVTAQVSSEFVQQISALGQQPDFFFNVGRETGTQFYQKEGGAHWELCGDLENIIKAHRLLSGIVNPPGPRTVMDLGDITGVGTPGEISSLSNADTQESQNARLAIKRHLEEDISDKENAKKRSVDVKWLSCDRCCKVYKSLKGLKGHIEREHLEKELAAQNNNQTNNPGTSNTKMEIQVVQQQQLETASDQTNPPQSQPQVLDQQSLSTQAQLQMVAPPQMQQEVPAPQQLPTQQIQNQQPISIQQQMVTQQQVQIQAQMLAQAQVPVQVAQTSPQPQTILQTPQGDAQGPTQTLVDQNGQIIIQTQVPTPTDQQVQMQMQTHAEVQAQLQAQFTALAQVQAQIDAATAALPPQIAQTPVHQTHDPQVSLAAYLPNPSTPAGVTSAEETSSDSHSTQLDDGPSEKSDRGEKRVSCPVCGETFSTTGNRTRHIKNKHHGVKYSCLYCEQVFTVKESVDYHIKAVHKMLRCDQCQTFYESQDTLDKHACPGNRTFEKVNCTACEKSYIGRHNLNKHYRAAHPDTKFPCDNCDQVFQSKANLYEHLRNEHIIIKCIQCDAALENAEEYAQHLSLVHTAALSKDTQVEEKSSIMCKPCGKTFVSFGNLTKHERLFHGHDRLLCQECPMLFNNLRKLEQHVNMVHRGITYNCQMCNLKFAYFKQLKKHQKQIHNTQGPIGSHACEACGKAFMYQCNLKRHFQRDHEGKIHICEICEENLDSEQALNDHKSSAHRGFHYKCPLCTEIFKTRREETDHIIAVHVGERPFECEVCHKTFNARSSLSKHVGILHKERSLDDSMTSDTTDQADSQLPLYLANDVLPGHSSDSLQTDLSDITASMGFTTGLAEDISGSFTNLTPSMSSPLTPRTESTDEGSVTSPQKPQHANRFTDVSSPQTMQTINPYPPTVPTPDQNGFAQLPAVSKVLSRPQSRNIPLSASHVITNLNQDPMLSSMSQIHQGQFDAFSSLNPTTSTLTPLSTATATTLSTFTTPGILPHSMTQLITPTNPFPDGFTYRTEYTAFSQPGLPGSLPYTTNAYQIGLNGTSVEQEDRQFTELTPYKPHSVASSLPMSTSFSAVSNPVGTGLPTSSVAQLEPTQFSFPQGLLMPDNPLQSLNQLTMLNNSGFFQQGLIPSGIQPLPTQTLELLDAQPKSYAELLPPQNTEFIQMTAHQGADQTTEVKLETVVTPGDSQGTERSTPQGETLILSTGSTSNPTPHTTSTLQVNDL